MRLTKRAWLVLKLENTDKILILKRSQTSRNPGKWGLIGGSSNKKIKAKKLIRKESLEEIGLSFEKLELFFSATTRNSNYFYFLGYIKEEQLELIQLNYEHSKYELLEIGKIIKKRKLHHSLKIFIALIINEALK